METVTALGERDVIRGPSGGAPVRDAATPSAIRKDAGASRSPNVGSDVA